MGIPVKKTWGRPQPHIYITPSIFRKDTECLYRKHREGEEDELGKKEKRYHSKSKDGDSRTRMRSVFSPRLRIRMRWLPWVRVRISTVSSRPNSRMSFPSAMLRLPGRGLSVV